MKRTRPNSARPWLLCGAMVIAVMPAISQTVPSLRDRLQQAAEISSLRGADLRPWHLIIDVQLFDASGTPTEKGTVEEWWQSPRLYRLNFTTPAYTASELHTETGAFHTLNKAPAPALLGRLLEQVVDPMPEKADLDTATPELHKKSLGTMNLDCIMVDHMAKLNGDAHLRLPVQLPMGIFPTYCFKPGEQNLLVSYDLGSQVTVRESNGTFQKRTVPLATTIYEGKGVVAKGQVAVLRAGQTPPPGTFTAGPDLEPSAYPTFVEPDIMGKSILKKTAPAYPQSAKDSHISGDVVIQAIIDRTGHIRFMRLLSTPDGDLALASLEAVRTWVYKPYMLKGEAVEVDTTITVHFRFG